MFKESVTPQDVVDLLNQLGKLDKGVLCDLLGARVPCGHAVATHPTIQVYSDGTGNFQVGMLGFLNGLFGVGGDGYGCIAVEVDEETKAIKALVRPERPGSGA